jgi:hypothetical protein
MTLKQRQDKFQEIFNIVLIQFQFVEEIIKNYLDFSYSIIKSRVSKDIEFNYSYEDVKNMSLQKLVHIFNKLSKRKDLVEYLNSIIPDRDFLAHRALLSTIAPHVTGENVVRINLEKICFVNSKVQFLFKELIEENGKIEKLKNEICGTKETKLNDRGHR